MSAAGQISWEQHGERASERRWKAKPRLRVQLPKRCAGDLIPLEHNVTSDRTSSDSHRRGSPSFKQFSHHVTLARVRTLRLAHKPRVGLFVEPDVEAVGQHHGGT